MEGEIEASGDVCSGSSEGEPVFAQEGFREGGVKVRLASVRLRWHVCDAQTCREGFRDTDHEKAFVPGFRVLVVRCE